MFFLFYKFNNEIKNNFTSFYIQSSKIFVYALNKDFENEKAPQYLKEFSTFYETWLMNKYIGGGIKILDIIVMKDLILTKTQSLYVTCIHIIII